MPRSSAAPRSWSRSVVADRALVGASCWPRTRGRSAAGAHRGRGRARGRPARRCSSRARIAGPRRWCSVLLIAERSVEPAAARSSPSAAGGRRAARRGRASRLAAGTRMQTEVFPLTLFALGGMMLFVAANDLLTMFVALEVLSLPLYLLCGLARRRRLLSQEAAIKYFLLGAFASAFFLYGLALLYGYAGSVRAAPTSPRRVGRRRARDDAAARRARAADRRPAVQGRRGAVPHLDAGRLPGRADAGHRVHGGLHEGRRVRRAAAGALRRRSAPTRWDWRPVIWVVAIAHDGGRRGRSAITQTDVKRHARLLLDRARRLHARSASIGAQRPARASSSTLFYLLAYGFTTIGAFAVVTLVRDADGEATPPVPVGGPGASARR